MIYYVNSLGGWRHAENYSGSAAFPPNSDEVVLTQDHDPTPGEIEAAQPGYKDRLAAQQK
ncbi:MAG: hypothetical protein P4N59_07475 [Negativicutes bacterium]|nr:hypothetical protein [Negativicutes bacterium]